MAKTEAPTRQGLMSDMFEPDNMVLGRRLKTTAITRSDSQVLLGNYYVGISSRPDVDVSGGDVIYSSVLKAGDNYVVIEDFIQNIDFSGVTDGKFTHTLVGYLSESNGNTFSYTPGTPLPAGRNLNGAHINDFPLAMVDVGVDATVAGEPDYPVSFASFFIDTSGNRSSFTETGASFFDGYRHILIPPNSELLIVAESAGGAIGSATIRTEFFMSEMTPEQVEGK